MGSQKKSIYYELLVLRCQREDKGALEELIRLFERQIFYYINGDCNLLSEEARGMGGCEKTNRNPESERHIGVYRRLK